MKCNFKIVFLLALIVCLPAFVMAKAKDSMVKPLHEIEVVFFNVLETEIEPVYRAAMSKSIESLKAILADNPELADFTGKEKVTPLYYSIYGRSPGNAELLLEHGASVEGPENASCTPLQYAVLLGEYEIAKTLVERGAETRYLLRSGLSMLDIAARFGYSDIFALIYTKDPGLLEIGKGRLTTLGEALQNGFSYGVPFFAFKAIEREQDYAAIVRLILKDEKNVRQRVDKEYLARLLVTSGDIEMMKILFDLENDKKSLALDFLQSFVFSATENDEKVLDYLLSFKPDLNDKSRKLLYKAVNYPKPIAVKRLLQHGASPLQEFDFPGGVKNNAYRLAVQKKEMGFVLQMLIYSPFWLPLEYLLLIFLAICLVIAMIIRKFKTKKGISDGTEILPAEN